MTSQKGSSHVIIIVGLVMLLIGSLGFIFWQNFVHTEEVVTKSEKTNTLSVSDEASKVEDSEPSDEKLIESSLKSAFPNILLQNIEVIGSNAHGTIVREDNGGMFWARKSAGTWKAYGVGADDYVGNATALKYGFPASKACNTNPSKSCWYYSDIDDTETANSYPAP